MAGCSHSASRFRKRAGHSTPTTGSATLSCSPRGPSPDPFAPAAQGAAPHTLDAARPALRSGLQPGGGSGEPSETRKNRNPSRIHDLGFPAGLSGASADALEHGHMWSIITWKSHLSPRRITLRPRWHPPSPVKGPSIGNPPTFIGGARCTFVTWPNTEQDRSQCSSKDPAGKPLAGSSPDDHRPAGKRSTSDGRLRGRLLFYTVLKLPASDRTKR